MKNAPYYILVGIPTIMPAVGNPAHNFELIFGDHNRYCVVDEKDACRNDYKKMKIIRMKTDLQSDIDDKVSSLNCKNCSDLELYHDEQCSVCGRQG